MRAILFDYGGTLDADGSSWLERFYPIYKENGLGVPRSEFDRAFYDADDRLPQRHRLAGLNLQETVLLQVQDVLERLAPARRDLAQAVAARFAADSRRHFGRLRPVLERLAHGHRLGVVSNFYGNLDGILRAEGLRDLFAVVADSGVLGISKPEPGIFLHAAQALGSEPADCVMVGDSIPRDMRGAAGVGMRRALIRAGGGTPEAGQDWTLGSVAELEAILS